MTLGGGLLDGKVATPTCELASSLCDRWKFTLHSMSSSLFEFERPAGLALAFLTEMDAPRNTPE